MKSRSTIVFHFETLVILILLSSSKESAEEDCNKPSPVCCNESRTTFQNCQYQFEVPSAGCRYIMRDDFAKEPLVNMSESPGRAREINVSLYRDTPHLIISWNLPTDSSVVKLKGFLLNVTFTLNGELKTILRSFRIDPGHITDEELVPKVVMIYDCITTFPSTSYSIKLTSQPKSNNPQTKEIDLTTPTYDFIVNPEDPPRNKWLARMWLATNPSERALNVCFYSAKEIYNFDRYYIFLKMTRSWGNFGDKDIVDNKTFYINSTEAAGQKICHKFRGMISGNYSVELQPGSPTNCKDQIAVVGIGKPRKDMGLCMWTVAGPVWIEGLQSTTTTGFQSTTTTDSSTSGPPPPPVHLLSIGIVILAIVIAIIMFFLRKYHKLPFKRKIPMLIIVLEDVNRSILSGPLVKHLRRKESYKVSVCSTTGDNQGTYQDKVRRELRNGSDKVAVLVLHWPGLCSRPHVYDDLTKSRLADHFKNILVKKYLQEMCYHLVWVDEDSVDRLEYYLCYAWECACKPTESFYVSIIPPDECKSLTSTMDIFQGSLENLSMDNYSSGTGILGATCY